MTPEEQIRMTLEILKKQKPDDDAIDRMHAKTEGELEHLVPSDPSSIALVTSEGEVGLDEVYKKYSDEKKKQEEKTANKIEKTTDKRRYFRILLHRR